MKPLVAAVASLSALVASVAPALSSAAAALAACPGGGAATSACGSCGGSSLHGYVSALGAGILVGIGSVAAERFVRGARSGRGNRRD